jgi:hypothetical protein
LVSNWTSLIEVVELGFRSTTKLVCPFLDFSKISYRFYKLSNLNRGLWFPTDRPLESFESLQLGPWPGYTGKLIGVDQILARGLTSGEGKVRRNVEELTAVMGVVGVGEERDCADISTANRGGRRSSEERRWCSGGRSAGGGGEVARELPRDDVVLMVCLAGARRQWITGTTARPSGGGSSSSPA